MLLTVISLVICAYFWPYTTDQLYAFISCVSVVLLCLAVLKKRMSITNVHALFITLFLIYQVVNPLLYVTYRAWVYKIDVFVGNWNLFTEGNLYSAVGMVGYICGIWASQLLPSVRWKRERMTPRRSINLMRLFFCSAMLGWLVLFIYAGYPTEIFTGGAPEGRYRGVFYGLYGHGYIMNLLFGANIALLFMVVARPDRSIFSPKILIFLYTSIVLISLDGSRLLFIMLPISVFVMKQLLVKQRSTIPLFRQSLWKQNVKYLAIIICLFGASVLYGQSRSLSQGGGLWERSKLVWDETLESQSKTWFYLANSFDTSITYFLVISQIPEQADFWMGRSLTAPLLNRIPTMVIPEKDEMLWGAQKFTKQFYGYDQHDANTVSRGPSMTAEAYMNFGALGVIAILFLFGVGNEIMVKNSHAKESLHLFKVFYVVYMLYFIPYVFKSGFSAALSYIDVKLIYMAGILFIDRVMHLATRRNDRG